MSRTSDRRSQFSFAGAGITFAVRALILTNIAVFAGQLILDIAFGDHYPAGPPGGLDKLFYSNGSLTHGWVWTTVTYMFLHAGLAHLFWNMLQLWFFGPDVERLLGTRQFIGFYLFCGVGGALANFVPQAFGRPEAAVLGASGAILGVLVAFAVNDPQRQLFLLPFPFPIPAWAMVAFIAVMNIVNGAQGGGNVSAATHLGGMVAGFAYMKLRPMTLRWSWQRRGRRVRRGRHKPHPQVEGGEGDEKKMADAIDNIFRFQDREKH